MPLHSHSWSCLKVVGKDLVCMDEALVVRSNVKQCSECDRPADPGYTLCEAHLLQAFTSQFVENREPGSGFSKLYKKKQIKRLVRGSRRVVTIYTYTGPAKRYDEFLDLRTNLDGQLRTKKGDPLTTDTGGFPAAASFEVIGPPA